MDRRTFLIRSAQALAAASTVSYFDIGASVQRHNQLVTPEFISREALRMLEDSLTFTKTIHRQYDERFKPGEIVNVRKPVRYTGQVGRELMVPEVYLRGGVKHVWFSRQILEASPPAVRDTKVRVVAHDLHRDAFTVERA